MTKEEWNEVEEALTSLYNAVELLIDGYKVSLKLMHISTYKNAIFVYVNGVFKGEWLLSDCEERRRFVRKVKKSLYKGKEAETVRKLMKKNKKDWEERNTYYVYDCYWSSFSLLKKHLERENENIELVKIY